MQLLESKTLQRELELGQIVFEPLHYAATSRDVRVFSIENKMVIRLSIWEVTSVLSASNTYRSVDDWYLLKTWFRIVRKLYYDKIPRKLLE